MKSSNALTVSLCFRVVQAEDIRLAVVFVILSVGDPKLVGNLCDGDTV